MLSYSTAGSGDGGGDDECDEGDLSSNGAPNWDPAGLNVLNNFNDYEFNGSVTAKVYPDGSEGGQLGDMTAAFVGDEQRGVVNASEVPSFLGNGYAFLMMVYSNDATGSETFSFQVYDLSLIHI